jgi:hypothetical protein
MWNSRKASATHKAIPLASAQVIEQAPMVSNLIKRLGVEINTLLVPDQALLLDLGQTS